MLEHPGLKNLPGGLTSDDVPLCKALTVTIRHPSSMAVRFVDEQDLRAKKFRLR